MINLLVDFGATRIKTAVYDTDAKQIIDTAEVASPSQVNHNTAPAFTVPLVLYRQAFADTAGKLIKKYPSINGIYICCEMHGFTVDDVYVSWKDSRADLSLIDKLKFYNETGMLARPGLAYATIKTLALTNKRIGTIVDSLLDTVNGNDITLTASQGFVSKNTKTISKLLLDEFSGCSLVPIVSGQLGTYQSYPVYAGLGDLQSALLGAGLGETADMVVNLGTGSQVAMITDDLTQGDLRPYVDDKWIRVISHIPAGRALNTIAEIVEPNRFWSIWQSLTDEQVLSADHEQVDLNLFASAWKFTNTSGFIRLSENQTVYQFVASVAASWVKQYVQAIRMLGDNTAKNIAVTGGLAHKSPFVLSCLRSLSSQHNFFQPSLITGEETLDGLVKLI